MWPTAGRKKRQLAARRGGREEGGQPRLRDLLRLPLALRRRPPPRPCCAAAAGAPPPPPHLRRLPRPYCERDDCDNPDHLSRLCNIETPPPPYCRFAMDDKIKPEDRAPSEDSRRTDHERLQPGSLSTDGQGVDTGATWCQLAYWEMNERVGKKFNVDQPAVNVFGSSHPDQGLCLDALADGGPSGKNASPENVARTRAKIGLGVILSREEDDVWVYNRSEQPIFVHSPLLDDIDTRTFLVYKVPPGHCLCIFDSEKAKKRPSPHWSHYSSVPTGPIDFNSVRISFAKGWGPKYTRQEVTACPCWLEVMLVPCR